MPAQSEYDGVYWHKKSGKWIGHFQDLLESAERGKRVVKNTKYFDDDTECFDALQDIKKPIEDEYWTSRTELAKKDDSTADLPLGPKDAKDAESKKAYWRPNYKNKHLPYRVVKGKHGKAGYKYHQCCKHGVGSKDACTNLAIAPGPGKPSIFCLAHGGGCFHGRRWQLCRTCNVNITESAMCCSKCGQQLNTKRMEGSGGTGICTNCEQQSRNEAAESGSEPPPKAKRWEDVVFDALIPLVVDAEGRVIPYEARDDMANMLGSNKQRRRGECSTDHQRRPDLYYLVRDADAHIVAALFVEVDEDSHTSRDPACEAGKVDETFQSILKLAQEEGKGRLAAARTGEIRTPFVSFFKFNPNACDAPGGIIRLDERIRVLAAQCRRFLNTPPEAFHQLSDAGHCVTPHVGCLYYHTKRGGAHLAYFDEHAVGAWAWHENKCTREAEIELRFSWE